MLRCWCRLPNWNFSFPRIAVERVVPVAIVVVVTWRLFLPAVVLALATAIWFRLVRKRRVVVVVIVFILLILIAVDILWRIAATNRGIGRLIAVVVVVLHTSFRLTMISKNGAALSTVDCRPSPRKDLVQPWPVVSAHRDYRTVCLSRAVP